MATNLNDPPAELGGGSDLARRVAALRDGSAEVMNDPWPLYADLRAHGPFAVSGRRWIVSGYEQVRSVYMDAERFGKELSDERHAEDVAGKFPDDLDVIYRELNEFERLMMPKVDDPQHARLRRIAHRAFTPRMIASLTDYVQSVTDQRLDMLEGRQQVDLIAELAFRVPLLVIARMLGVPKEDADLIHEWSSRRAAFVTNESHGSDSLAPWHRALGEFRAYVEDLVRTLRDSDPDTNLVAALLDRGAGGLSNDELVAMFVVLLFAGHETTTNLIGNGMAHLLKRPEQWRRLVDDPSLLPTAVEELLRFDAPIQSTYRIAHVQTEIGSARIEPGDIVLMLIAAANHDPDVFAAPEQLDVARDPNRHLSFIVGQRFCLGASLARLEGRIAFAELTRRWPQAALVDEELSWRPGYVLRGLERLTVAPGDTVAGPGASGRVR